MVNMLRDPAFLLLIPLVLAGAWWLRTRVRPTIALPTLAQVPARIPLRVRMLRLIPILRILALVALAVAVARPRTGQEQTLIRRQGLAIEIVIDRSGSMEEEMRYGGGRVSRLEVVKRIFADFITGSTAFPGRKTDLVGLTTFARFAEERCPLVGRYEPLLRTVANLKTVAPFLDKVRRPVHDRRLAVAQNPLNATAIGEALQRAVLALVGAEQDLREASEQEAGAEPYTIEGKVVILLTDGQSNAGRPPLKAADFAKRNGVRVYPIVVFDRTITEQGLFGPRVQRELTSQELAGLMAEPQRIAEVTGGRAYMAESADELQAVVGEIDRLEKTDLGEIEYAEYDELFHWPLAVAFVLLTLSTTLESTWLRVAP